MAGVGRRSEGRRRVSSQVTATNPAHRVIDVSVEDQWFEGATPSGTLVNTANGTAPVPAATETLQGVLIPGTHTWTFSKTIDSAASEFNDVAIATYTDAITGVPVPGTTKATASTSVVGSKVLRDATASLADVESITGAGFEYSVDTVTPDVGSFGAYVPGTPTVDDVTCTTTLSPPGTGEAFGSFVFGSTHRAAALAAPTSLRNP